AAENGTRPRAAVTSEQVRNPDDTEDPLELRGAVVVDLDPAGAAVGLARLDPDARAEALLQAPLELLQGWIRSARRRPPRMRRGAAFVRHRLGFAHRQAALAHERSHLALLFDRVRPEEGARVPGADLAGAHALLDVVRQLQQSQRVGDRAAALAEALRQLD